VGRVQRVPGLWRIPHLAIVFASMGNGSSCQQHQTRKTQHLISYIQGELGYFAAAVSLTGTFAMLASDDQPLCELGRSWLDTSRKTSQRRAQRTNDTVDVYRSPCFAHIANSRHDREKAHISYPLGTPRTRFISWGSYRQFAATPLPKQSRQQSNRYDGTSGITSSTTAASRKDRRGCRGTR